MTEEQLYQIRGIYGEIIGWIEGLPSENHPNGFPTVVTGDMCSSYNMEVTRLTQLTSINYNNAQLTHGDSMSGTGRSYYTTNVKMKMSSLARRLEQEYGLGQRRETTPPIVVSVNQNQQVAVTVTPIQQFIDSTTDDALRQDLEDLRVAVESDRNPERASTILDRIRAHSWEVFIKIMPYVLEHLGDIHSPHH